MATHALYSGMCWGTRDVQRLAKVSNELWSDWKLFMFSNSPEHRSLYLHAADTPEDTETAETGFRKLWKHVFSLTC